MISLSLRNELLELAQNIETATNKGKRRTALATLKTLRNKIGSAKDPIEEMFRAVVSQKHRCNYIRILTPNSDSGWLNTGRNIDTNVKYYARTRGIGTEGYFFSKNDYLRKQNGQKNLQPQ